MRFFRLTSHLPVLLVLASLAGVAACGEESAVGPAAVPTAPDFIHPAVHLDCGSPEDIEAVIDALEADGTLNHGQATALRAQLARAERHEAAGRTHEAAAAYARLIAQVEEWVADGVLTEEEAADLLDCADDVADGPDSAASFAYVANFDSDDVSVIETSTNTVATTVAIGDGPQNVAITPDGDFAYVTNGLSDNMSVMATATNAVTATVDVGVGPRAVAITPDAEP